MMEWTERPLIDVSELPTVAFGSRAPLWWGVAGLITIESMMFALLAACYFYLRGGASVWPPPRNVPSLSAGTWNLALLLLSLIPMHLGNRAAAARSLKGMRKWLLVTTAFSLVCLALRAVELNSLNFRWDAHAYGSIVWVIFGMHSLHLLTSNVENLLFLALLFKGPIEEKHLLDLRLNGMYWFFVVLVWIPFYIIVFLDPGIFRMGAM
jgi:cytochrome c oxidase subunit 1/cytochrome c oxidase subunit I+III